MMLVSNFMKISHLWKQIYWCAGAVPYLSLLNKERRLRRTKIWRWKAFYTQ
jgi:hypothetical protein